MPCRAVAESAADSRVGVHLRDVRRHDHIPIGWDRSAKQCAVTEPGRAKAVLAIANGRSAGDVEDSVGAAFGIGHDVVDEGIAAGFRQDELHETALRR